MIRFIGAILLAWAMMIAQPVHAAFQIVIGNATVTTGSSAVVDVTIQELNSESPTRLDFYATEYRIDVISGATPGGLRFADPQTTDILGNSGYVFFGDSTTLGFSRDVNPITKVLNIGHFTTSGTGVDITSATLLARLDISALSGLTNGTQYRISLVNAGTQFQDSNGDSLNFVNTAGIITIQGSTSTATPAPSGLLVALVGSGIFSLVMRKRRKVH
jgi:hypothetical protein